MLYNASLSLFHMQYFAPPNPPPTSIPSLPSQPVTTSLFPICVNLLLLFFIIIFFKLV